MAERSFGLSITGGLVGAGAAAYAATKGWWHPVVPNNPLAPPPTVHDAPTVLALSLVVLAAWGVVLVTRGFVRRAVLALAGVVALAALVPWWTEGKGLDAGAGVSRTAWPTLALIALVVAIVAAAVGIVRAGNWPEMGRRYDAPAAAPAPKPLEEQSSLDVWKQMDEGRDPTSDAD